MDKVQRILNLITAIKIFDEGNSGYAVGKWD
jgi:hypothetical protein